MPVHLFKGRALEKQVIAVGFEFLLETQSQEEVACLSVPVTDGDNNDRRLQRSRGKQSCDVKDIRTNLSRLVCGRQISRYYSTIRDRSTRIQ